MRFTGLALMHNFTSKSENLWGMLFSCSLVFWTLNLVYSTTSRSDVSTVLKYWPSRKKCSGDPKTGLVCDIGMFNVYSID